MTDQPSFAFRSAQPKPKGGDAPENAAETRPPAPPHDPVKQGRRGRKRVKTDAEILLAMVKLVSNLPPPARKRVLQTLAILFSS